MLLLLFKKQDKPCVCLLLASPWRSGTGFGLFLSAYSVGIHPALNVVLFLAKPTTKVCDFQEKLRVAKFPPFFFSFMQNKIVILLLVLKVSPIGENFDVVEPSPPPPASKMSQETVSNQPPSRERSNSVQRKQKPH